MDRMITSVFGHSFKKFKKQVSNCGRGGWEELDLE